MIAKLRTYVLDARDIKSLSTFYGSLTGWSTASEDDEWIAMTTDNGWRIGFQPAPDLRPPRWPDPAAPQQAHLDLGVPDIDAAADKAVELGATVLRRNETWHTLADPEGHPFDVCLRADDPKTTLLACMLDCPDAKALATFYSELLGKPITYEGDGAMMIGEEGAQPVMFQQIEDYRPPRWPDPAAPQQVHFDLVVERSALESAEAAALAIGATKLPGGGDNWQIYADPAGKPFCFTWSV